MTPVTGRALRRIFVSTMLLAALAACATPTTDVQSTTEEAVYTASGRYPAERAGILIAQNAALRNGRGVCEQQGKRFRPLGSVAGQDPSTGEAIFAVRFRCTTGRTTLPPTLAPNLPPLPSRDPRAGGSL